MRFHIAAEFDDLTNLMLGWLKKLTSGEAKQLFGEAASREVLLLSVRSMPEDGLLLIFYGHGTPSGLLTAAHLGAPIIDHDKAYLCVSEDLEHLSKIEVFAYCCSSSLEFGANIRQKNGNRYVGYRGELLFSTAPFESDAFERPLINTVSKLIENGGVYDSIVKDLVLDYEVEHRRWSEGEYSDEDRAMMVCMFLEEHVRLLDRDT